MKHPFRVFLQWYSQVRKPLVAETDLCALQDDIPNILKLVKTAFPNRSGKGRNAHKTDPDKAWGFTKFHMFRHFIPSGFLPFGQLDNTSTEAFETAHKELVKKAWIGTNRKDAEQQVMVRANRERALEFATQEEARFCEAYPDDEHAACWPFSPTWRTDEKEAHLLRRREMESFFFPINKAASKAYRQHATYVLASGNRKGGGRPRLNIPLRVLNTADPYTRDNPGLKYLSQGLVIFLLNFHAPRLRLSQVRRLY